MPDAADNVVGVVDDVGDIDEFDDEISDDDNAVDVGVAVEVRSEHPVIVAH